MAKRFRFHGHAIGAGGRIEHPFHEFIEIQAASALPEIGGHGSAESSNFRYRNILRFDQAQTEVTGSHTRDANGKPVHKTLVRTRVDGVDIMGVVTADRVEVRLVAFTDDDPDDEPCFKFTGTHFDNLKIAGVPVTVDLAVDVFDRFQKHKDLARSYARKEDFHTLFQQLTLKAKEKGAEKPKIEEAPARVRYWFQEAPEPEKGSELPHFGGVTTTTLVRKLDFGDAKLPCWGHVFYIEGFGTIHLAEVSVSKHERHVTMLRVDLGSPVDGNLDVGTGCGGGFPY